MAYPNWQANGTAAEGASGASVSPAWPAHQAGDIGLLLVESRQIANLTVTQGFREIPGSPRGDRIGTTNYNRCAVYWKRAASGAEPAPTVRENTGGEHVRAVIITFRGVNSGTPWNAWASNDTDGASSTSVVIPGHSNIPDNESLIVGIVAYRLASAAGQVSGWTNSGLTELTERYDLPTNTYGSGFAVVTGKKALAGSLGDTTATLNSTIQERFMLSLTAVQKPAPDTIPYVHGYGEHAESDVANISPAWPSGHAAGDIGLLLIESQAWPVTVSAPQGFTEITASPQNSGVSGATAAASLKVLWKRAASGAELAPTVNLNTNHIRARIITVRGAKSSGSPFADQAGSASSGESTSITFPGLTTTVPNTLVLNLLGQAADNNLTRVNSWTNTSLEEFNKFLEDPSVIGSGSGFAVLAGKKKSAGSVNGTTATMTSSSGQGRISLAILPPSVDEPLLKGSFAMSGKAAILSRQLAIVAAKGSFLLTGKAADLSSAPYRFFVLTAEKGSFIMTGKPAGFVKLFGRWIKEIASKPATWIKKEPPDGT